MDNFFTGTRRALQSSPHAPHMRREAGAAEAAGGEYLLEAKKFIERARAAYSAEARETKTWTWPNGAYSRAIEEAGHKPPQQAGAKPTGQAAGNRTDGALLRPRVAILVRRPKRGSIGWLFTALNQVTLCRFRPSRRGQSYACV